MYLLRPLFYEYISVKAQIKQKKINPFRVVLDQAYRGLAGGFLLLRTFSVAISVSPHVYFILILISMCLR